MESSHCPKLIFLHSENALNPATLEVLSSPGDGCDKNSLLPQQPGPLKVRPDGTVLDGHHRLSILIERGENIDALPREIIRRKTMASSVR